MVRKHNYTDEELLQMIRDKAEELGRAPKKGEVPECYRIKSRFGTWYKSVIAAGLEPYKGPSQKKEVKSILGMAILEQSCVFCTVKREGERIASQTVLLSKEFEAQAQLIVDINHFKIIDAEMEISKTSGSIPIGKRKALELIGNEAYFDINRVLGRLKAPDYDQRVKSLFFECVKCLIQAETYVFAERGYPSEAAYEDYWHEREKNGCRYYSQSAPCEPGWFEHVGRYKRESNLFNRCKNYKLIDHGSEWMAQGTFSDSFHEMNAEIRFDRNTGIIRKSELLVFRAPGSVCFENRMHGELFEGKSFYTMDRKEITETVGGAQGCYHLRDLLMDLADMVREQRKWQPDIVYKTED